MTIAVRVDNETYSVLRFLADKEGEISAAKMVRRMTLAYCATQGVLSQPLSWRYESTNADYDRWITKYPCDFPIADFIATMTALDAEPQADVT